ncbi:SCO family protein [Metabacillus idriensis]|uniref:SCO family protein n=1 Tax=Metabacillus idriensis TaxID=324768 RepID=UPI00399027E8
MQRFSLPFVLLFILLLSGCGQGIKDPINKEINEFTFKNQNGKDFGLENLKGDVWVADFIFTSCETVCPPMTANMTKLNQQLKEKGIEDIKFVSFSVDPEVDTPEKIKEFMSRYELNSANWNFLTGYSKEAIDQFAEKSFQTIVAKPNNEDQVIHGTLFFLVDRNGTIVKDYSAVSNVPYDQIIKDIKSIR